jgi:hypothetical protein
MKFILSSISENRSCSTAKCAGGDTANGARCARGATLAELVAALKPWSESSVKSALYWDVAKAKGCGVRTETSDDGTQRHRLVLPEGVEAPLGHLEPATVKMAANEK